MKYNKLISQLDKDIVLDFFSLFSRFEYALKKSNNYVSIRKGAVFADWDKFVLKTNDRYCSFVYENCIEEISYLKQNRPKKQYSYSGCITWKENPTPEIYSYKDLIDDIKQIRNNLFHGGKYFQTPLEEPSRNSMLLSICIRILECCLEIDDNLLRIFLEDL